MPRASWRGFLRLSLVSCPIYFSPATTRTKPIRLHQVWQPASADVDEDDLPDRSGGRQGSERSVTRLRADSAAPDGEQSLAATRITLRPHDSGTAEEIEKREVVKGYRDRYQEALQQLIDAKMKGVTIEPRVVSTPSPVIDLMAALKRSLAQEPSAPEQTTAKRKQTKKAPDRRQPVLLLPLTGSRKGKRRPSADPAVASIKKRIASIKKRSRGG
jgi:non-homologous end joining protein Ku